jgi:hypothetical protein
MGARRVRAYVAADSASGEALDRLGLLEDAAWLSLSRVLAQGGLVISSASVPAAPAPSRAPQPPFRSSP